MRHSPLLILCLALVALAGCKTVPLEVAEASLLAYWSPDPSALRCPDGVECVTLSTSQAELDLLTECFRGLLPEGESKPCKPPENGKTLEMVRLEAIDTGTITLWAAVWGEPSDGASGEHVFEPGIHSKGFQGVHAQYQAEGRPLVHLAVWMDHGHARFAGIWGAKGSVAAAEQVLVDVDLGWKALEKRRAAHLKEPPGTRHYLDQIEVYPTPAGDGTFVAAVWRPGEQRYELIYGDSCFLSLDPIQPDGERSCEPDGDDMIAHANACPVFKKIHEMEGFRPTDFEPYTLAGHHKMAVLLQPRATPDWLMVPGSFAAIACRHDWFLGEERVATHGRLGLLDLDLIRLGDPNERITFFHNGLVHDGGTSGGPPGSTSGLVADDPATDAPPETTSDVGNR